MKDFAVKHGRINWVLFALLVYPAINLLALDYVWRVVDGSIETILSFAVLANIIVVSATFLGWYMLRKRRARFNG